MSDNTNGAAIEQQRPIEYVDIDLDRPRKLLLNHNAIALAERDLKRITGEWVPFPQLLARIKLCGMSETIVVLWAALRHEDSDLTQVQCANIMRTIPMSLIVEKLIESVKQHFPSDVEAGRSSTEDPFRANNKEPSG